MPSCRVSLPWIKWFCKGQYRKRSAVRTGRRRRSRKKFKGKLVLFGFIGIRQRTEGERVESLRLFHEAVEFDQFFKAAFVTDHSSTNTDPISCLRGSMCSGRAQRSRSKCVGTDKLVFVRMAAKLAARVMYAMNSGILSLPWAPSHSIWRRSSGTISFDRSLFSMMGYDDATGYRAMMPSLAWPSLGSSIKQCPKGEEDRASGATPLAMCRWW